ncbi:sensor histidine kinase [Paractinoplanes atraurantiacus]|uniref:Two-component system, NarL family, sensor histidine kinase DesK n=1 Tax=Paractinoplanes atraurantiacus TaxID=1036182 RepID=A0A285IB34_9ACTN|nr:histidine kinase [Actinoplanes atraurantiacus]SNY45182.1 two-component system, NarL family, sensor histidine kinase DesK [Actinoplanes atraurantiacus]
MTVTRESGRFRYGALFAAVWLFYLTENVKALLETPDLWWRYAGLVAVLLFAVGYVALAAQARTARRDNVQPPGFVRQMWLGLILLLALFALQVPGAGNHALTCLVYVAALAMVSLPLKQAVPLAAALFALAEILPPVVPGWHDNGYGLAVLLGSFATYGIRIATDRQNRLVAAQSELAELAVQNERARIAADLHDILGHSLTVVAVKAELAQRLLDVDVEKARAELRDLEALSRDALADVRATAMGMRGISLPGEIAAAREALAAANVEAELPGVADEVPSRNRELFAWTIREAVTNIVRHSHATHAQVRVGPGSVEILDDGPVSETNGGGQGLAGLRRRAEAAGATFTAGRREDHPGFRVRVEVPT